VIISKRKRKLKKINSENYISLMTKNLIIFDLDGVLFDSKKNMEISWNFVKKKYQLKIKFESYFQNIGMPFLNILKKLILFNQKKKQKNLIFIKV
jgi:beta-phosphoglucomutase-like phosphatase (HAD superfamily)